MRGVQREAGAPRLASTLSTGSPSRADARSAGGACFRRHLLALLLAVPGLFTGAPGLVAPTALLLGALSLFPAAPAAAQSVLVSTIGQTDETNNQQQERPGFTVVAQGFTTGSNTGGYTLTSIQAVLSGSSGATADFTNLKVELWSNSSGDAGTKIADLTKPASYSAGTMTFTAPASTTLAASTTYHVVFYVNPRSSSPGFLILHTTASDAEDSGGADGWSIANGVRKISNAQTVSGTWTGGSNSLRMRVNGAAAQQTTAPSAPTNLVVMPGSGSLDLSWTAPSGSAPSGYDVHYTSAAADVTNDAAASGSDASAAWVAVTRSGSTATQAISSLSNGTTYRVRVRARASGGGGGNADILGAWVFGTGTPVAPQTLAAPTGLSVTAGDASLGLSWTAPTGTLTGYDVHYTSAAASSVANNVAVQTGSSATAATGWLAVTRSGTTASQTISSLNNGTWVFGTGTPATNTVTLSASSTTVTEGQTVTFTISLTAAATRVSGFDPTISYTVTRVTSEHQDHDVTEVNNLASAASIFLPSGQTSHTFEIPTYQETNSQDQEDETFTVALTSVPTGYSIGSPSSVTITIIDDDKPPAAPTSLNVTPGNAKLDLSWTAPSGTLTGYDVHYTSAAATGSGSVANDATASGSNPATAWVAVTRSGSTATQTISSLSNSTTYRVRVRARNSNGGGAWLFGTGTPSNVPGVPTGLTVTPGNAKLDLSWTAPTGTVTGYDVHYTSASKTGNSAVTDDAAVQTGNTATAATGWLAVTRTASVEGTTPEQTIASLSNSTTYRVRVRAKKSNGNGAWVFGTGAPKAPPAAPTNLSTSAQEESLEVTWTASTSTGSAAPTYYEVAFDVATRTVSNLRYTARTASGTATSLTIDSDSSGLTIEDGTQYRVTIRACNPVCSAYSGNETVWTQVKAPAVIANLVVTPGDETLALSWTLNFSGGPIVRGAPTVYEVAYTTSTTVDGDADVGTDPATDWVDAGYSDTSLATSYTITGLTNGQAYQVRVWPKRILSSAQAGSLPSRGFGTGTPEGTIRVTLGPSSVRVEEGKKALLNLGFSRCVEGYVTSIRVTTTRITSEGGDHGFSLGQPTQDHTLPIYSWNCPSGNVYIDTYKDDDYDDEEFRIELNPDHENWPDGYVAGGQASVTVTIRDVVPVAISANPNPVKAGSPVRVRVWLPGVAAPDGGLVVPVKVTRDTSEESDHGDLTSITIPAGVNLSETMQLPTYEDKDGEHETFTVSLDTEHADWPDGYIARSDMSSAQVTIADDNASSPPPITTTRTPTSNPGAPTETTTTTTTTTTPRPRDLSPSFSSSASVPAQSYTEGTEITPLELPAARGGDGRLFYALSPVLPEGLTLNRSVRRLSGTPTSSHAAREYTWTATDADGDAARITFTVTVVPDLRPSFDNVSVPDQAYIEGTAITPLVLPEATGGNNPLTYALSPSLPNGLTLNEVTRRLSGNPISPQDTTRYTWTATDADGDEATLTFTIAIAVDPHRQRVREAARRILVEMARRAMSGALDTIGARFGAIGGSGLSLAGQPVSLESVASVADGVGMAVWNNQSLALGELLGESAFSLRLAATGEAGDGEINSEGPLWSVWGRGDLASFAGGREEETHYDGWLRSGWLGLDARSGRWVGGMTVSHEQGQADYGATMAAAADDRPMQGRLETSLTALYPYGRWTLANGLELQGVVGVGWGEARHTPADEQQETGTLSMKMASLGVRKSLPDVAGLALALRADAAVTRIETGDGPDTIHNLSADSWRLRTGLEASRRFSLEGEAFLEPFLEAAARQDGGDGLEGSGVELAGGLRYSAPSVAVELRGRWLAAHSEEGAEEQGISLTARYGPGADGQGLFFALSPRWGAATGGAQSLWGEDLPVLSTASAEDSGAVDAQLGYGFVLPQGGVLTPFAEVGMAGADSRRLRLGTRYAAAVTGLEMAVELAGERRESGDAAAEHALQLDVDLRF